MAEQMTISKVLGHREWDGQHGPMVTYKLELEQLEGVHELNQKPTTPPPVVGESIFAEVEPSSKAGFPPLLKKQRSGYRGKSDSPDQRRSIERQVAAKCATDLAVAGKIDPHAIGGYIDSIARKIEGN